MIRILPVVAALAACASPHQEAAMDREPDSANALKSARKTAPGSDASGAANGGAGREGPAALGSAREPISAVKASASALPADSPAEARGRRILSTAFVMMGPDGYLSVELHDGRSLVMRNVVMHRRKYCGQQVFGSQAGARYCGGYADVAAARAGPAAAHEEPDLAVPNPLEARPLEKD